MACGCKAKNSVVYTDPKTGQVKKTRLQADGTIKKVKVHNSNGVQQKRFVFIPFSQQEYKQLRKQLDVSSITKPDELCFNCVRKHLGMAYMFSQFSDAQHILTGIGQLLCAATHLKKQYPNLSLSIWNKALQGLRKIEQLKQISQNLVIQFQQDPQKDGQQVTQLQATQQQLQLLTLLLVNSLLFVQLSYQQINKTWATAQLSLLSYNSFIVNNNTKEHQDCRPLWKLIQSMHSFDQNYFSARNYLHSLIKNRYSSYKQNFNKLQLQQCVIQQNKPLPQSS